MEAQWQRWRIRLVHQRRAIRALSRRAEYLTLKLQSSNASAREAWHRYNETAREFQRFRGNYMRRIFGWRVHVWRNNWVLQWPPYDNARVDQFNAMLKVLWTKAYHAGGCGKWDADNRFHEQRPCTCGLADAFKKGGRCYCSTCVTERAKRHAILQRTVEITGNYAAVDPHDGETPA